MLPVKEGQRLDNCPVARHNTTWITLAHEQICERTTPYEREVVERWWALPRFVCLPLVQGGWCQLLFAGRPGGSAGPDVRDAILRFLPHRCSPADVKNFGSAASEQVVGDVEFHVHISDWRVHQHEHDARYNSVLLHVVLLCDDTRPTRRQDGGVVPVCSLADVATGRHKRRDLPAITIQANTWPCQRQLSGLNIQAQERLLQRAGLLRFEEKSHKFLEDLHQGQPVPPDIDAYDVCLFLALAEGLGYGRDREIFRALGAHLLWKQVALPEPLGHKPLPAPLDRARLQVLSRLFARWRIPGIWHTLRACLLPVVAKSDKQLLADLRTCFGELGLSIARTDIVLCNVVLPFAYAIALLEQHTLLAERAQSLYLQHPGLPSNRITRSMCLQLGLDREPHGSCLQQGLHYIYQHTCREKLCSNCMLGIQRI
ncbi:hypothetical protein KDA_13640 [Dictyobacter alpinus]|uniref:DUF2851 domain-containing protein n=1 Tax=Dictyobacter alpinus TaxID=2014873 RepID=A0A402B3E8_9CHLR|nr:DUF2851 family protein [Dictyobacter alpinus]GCE25880.1 hypothetical protein KDA_13640 [Dictyobacter alpinus]